MENSEHITEENMRGIMPCYCSINGESVSASKKVLTGLLRDEMGFDGICVSDYGAVGNVYNAQKVGESITEAVLLWMRMGIFSGEMMQNTRKFTGHTRSVSWKMKS